jgi:hypothetical protein
LEETIMAAPQFQRSVHPADVDYEIAEEEEYYVTRPHTSVRRYRQPVQRDTLDDYTPRQTSFIQRRKPVVGMPASGGITSKAVDPSPVTPLPRIQRKRPPWLALALGMMLTLALVICFNAFSSWWQLHQEDATYGMPRTYQTNAVVGHQDSANKPSHFIFLNLNGRVVIVEFPGGDTTHSLIYSGPTLFGSGGNLVPVTGEFRDVNGDGRLDMVVHVQDQTIIFINDGGKFRASQPGEHFNL